MKLSNHSNNLTMAQELTINAIAETGYYKTITAWALKKMSITRTNNPISETCENILKNHESIQNDLEQEIFLCLWECVKSGLLVHNPTTESTRLKKTRIVEKTHTKRKIYYFDSTNQKVSTKNQILETTKVIYTDNNVTTQGNFTFYTELNKKGEERSGIFRIFRTIENFLYNERKNEGYVTRTITKDGIKKKIHTIAPLRVDLYDETSNEVEVSVNNRDYAKFLNISYELHAKDVIQNQNFDIGFIIKKFLEKNPKCEDIKQIIVDKLKGFTNQEIAERNNIKISRIKYLLNVKLSDFIKNDDTISLAFRNSLKEDNKELGCAFPIRFQHGIVDTIQKVKLPSGTITYVAIQKPMQKPTIKKIVNTIPKKATKKEIIPMYNRDMRIRFWEKALDEREKAEIEYRNNINLVEKPYNLTYCDVRDSDNKLLRIQVYADDKLLHTIPAVKH